MKLIPRRFIPAVLLSACVAGAALLGAALAQPPVPGGTPGKGAPGPGPGGPGGAGPGPGGPGGGPGPGTGAPSPTFVLRGCNKSNDVQLIFVAVVGIVGKQFRAQGWGQLPRGQCVNIGTFNRPTVWWHARDPSGTTWGQPPDVDLCVNLNGGFDYSWGGSGRQCQQGETAVPFIKQEIVPTTNTFDLNMN